jgi:hypothetical protein
MAARSIIALREGCGRTSVMKRGNRREASFEDDADREIFMATLAEKGGKTGRQVHAWCLMRRGRLF